VKILFVGNSYTYYNDMPAIFDKLSKENGKDVTVFSVTKGGHYLRQCFEDGDVCGMKLAELVKEHHFDVCILQEQSTYPVRMPEQFVADVRKMAAYLAPFSDKFVLYATWGRQIGAKFLQEAGMTTETMNQALWNAYKQAAQAISADLGREVALSPVGLHFAKINAGGEVDLYNPDLSHPSYEGSCLAAMTHYRTLFGEVPEKLATLELTEQVAALFKQAVAAAE